MSIDSMSSEDYNIKEGEGKPSLQKDTYFVNVMQREFENEKINFLTMENCPREFQSVMYNRLLKFRDNYVEGFLNNLNEFEAKDIEDKIVNGHPRKVFGQFDTGRQAVAVNTRYYGLHIGEVKEEHKTFFDKTVMHEIGHYIYNQYDLANEMKSFYEFNKSSIDKIHNSDYLQTLNYETKLNEIFAISYGRFGVFELKYKINGKRNEMYYFIKEIDKFLKKNK
jgi:hypothetical protein